MYNGVMKEGADMNIEIANRLVSMRKQNQLSQEQLAEKLGISRQAVSKWERAESSPDTDNLILLAKLYNVSLDELLYTDEEVLPSSQYITIEEEKSEKYAFKFKNAALRKFPYPILVTIVFLLLGIFFDIWHPAWILYLTIPIYYWAVFHFEKD